VTFLRVLRDRLRALAGHGRVVDEIDLELRQHEARLAARLEQDGLAPAAARAEARRRVGDPVRLREAGYDVRGGGFMESVLHDIRYGFRTLRRSPGFTLAALVTLALGIGGNTAIFSVANGVLLRPLPYSDPDRLAMVWMTNARINLREDWHSFPNYWDYRTLNTTFDDMALFNGTSRTLTGEGDPDRITGAYSSANLFDVMGVRPIRGRVYTPEEDRPGASRVLLLSHGLWQRRFGGRDDAIGKVVQMNGVSMQIIGVMPATFAFPTRETEFWEPVRASDAQRANRGSLWLQVVGRIKTGVSLAQAQADLDRVNAGILERFPQQKGYGVYVANYRDQLVGRVRPAILVLLGAVGFVLLIACTNVANLLLSRTMSRERELALRAAIGAGRGRLVRQLLTESVLLGAVGGLMGLGLAWLGLRAILGAAPPDLPRLDAIALDGRVLGFTLGLSLVTGLLFGLLPAVQMARTSPGETLKDGARSTSALGRSLRRGLVALEMAMAVVLLVAAGLMIRSFDRLQRVDLGFRPDQLLTARVGLWGDRYRPPQARVDFFAQLLDRVAARPEVSGAAGIGTVFLTATPNSTNFTIEGRGDFAPEDQVEVPVDAVTPDYFRVMGIRLLQGRQFDARDTRAFLPPSPPAPPGGPPAPPTPPPPYEAVVIINETMAKMFWKDDDPVGRRIKYGQQSSQGPWMTIVGVVADTRRTGYDAPVRPETYLPHAQSPDSGLMLVVRTNGDPAAFLPSLRSIVREIDPGMAVQGGRALESLLVEMTAQRRLNTLLLSVFGVVAALLAAVGIYGVIAYSVEQRAKELSVRVALGASTGRILRLVMTEGLAMSAAGLAVGLGAALALSRSMTSMLYNVTATDPATFMAITGVAMAVALGASVIPALRATRANPVDALKGS
jgi:putative ABC transport system permease protein